MTHRLTNLLYLLLALPISTWAAPRVDLGGGHMGLAQVNTCPNQPPSSYSCTELDDDWPDQGLACPEADRDIPRHTLAIMSAMMIQLGKYKPVKKEEFPIDECYTSKPNSTVTDYGFISQGTFDMWLFAHDKCECKPGSLPVCNDQATETDKCNLRTFTLCKVTKKGTTCKPKHHAGWKPLPIIPDRLANSDPTSPVDPDEKPPQSGSTLEVVSQSDLEQQLPSIEQQQQTFNIRDGHSFSFMSLSAGWWKLLELLGIFGVL
ncbi:hypothetical protein CROQUDRAFT_660520 [Cronartium quercuum f. sp. fusiforme G11]|uniref:Uncharacterized protein n=1 Tax=Cronartium quercuum f. sp. fusiforme G11 TaxID=708437 RepID=A0A9P6NI02_9BASI|nr:hypothetical protein CROQUDRAFT_660520 [Cronartium quercuum f. sp. fusiforme G11]